MKRIVSLIWYWAPPFLLMVTIFMLSSRQNIGVSSEESVNFILFKTLHIIEYAVLYFLLFRALLKTTPLQKNPQRAMVWAAVLAVLYGISDEIHQTFVPTRTGKLRDVFIDIIGISLMVMYTKRYIQFIKRNLF